MRVMIPKRLAAVALPATLLGVERLLVARAFRAVIRSEITDGRYFWRWDRDRGWAVDRVEAVYRVHSAHGVGIGKRPWRGSKLYALEVHHESLWYTRSD